MKSIRLPIAAIALIAVPALADDDHQKLPPAVDAFHDLISKDWHAKEGPERLKSACANGKAYVKAAKKVASDKAPEHADAAKWKLAATALGDASAALGVYCKSANDGNVLGGLTTLHDRFHDLVKLVMHK